MRLAEYAEQRGHGSLARVAQISGVSSTTIRKAASGAPIKLYEIAKRISDATGGLVTVADLCGDPDALATPPKTDTEQLTHVVAELIVALRETRT